MEYYSVTTFIYILIFTLICNVTGNSDSWIRTMCPNTISQKTKYLSIIRHKIISSPPFSTKKENKVNESTSKILQQDQLIDIWGYKINWYDKEDGWTDLRRDMILQHNKKMMKQIQNMPAFTKYGYQKMKIPVELHNLILQSMKQNSSGLVNEPCTQDDPFHNCQRVKNDGTIELKYTIKIHQMTSKRVIRKIYRDIESALLPILESWSGQKLSKDAIIYGVRRYYRGAWMLMHVDRLPTHIISAILQIDQKVDKDWPLTLIDHEGGKKKVFLKPGEMLLYESAKMPHGRQFPLEGDFYDNLFAHFQLMDPVEQSKMMNLEIGNA